jgi:hypothetical protein
VIAQTGAVVTLGTPSTLESALHPPSTAFGLSRPYLAAPRAHGWGSVLSNALRDPLFFGHWLIGYNVIHVRISLLGTFHPPPGKFGFGY